MDNNSKPAVTPVLLFPGQYLLDGSVGPLKVNYDLNDPCQQMAEVVITRGIYVAKHYTADECAALAEVFRFLATVLREPKPPF